MEITAQQFREIGQQRELPQGPRIAFAVLLALALAVTITQPAPLVGMLVLAVAFAGCIVVWWKFMRRSGERFNNYDPLKPDTEMQRTATDWKEEFRLVAVVAASFVLVNLGSIWPGWISGLIVGVIGFAVFFYLLGRKPSRPEKYTLPEELVAGRDASAVVATGNDALLAGMYALKMVTGGVQIQKHIAVDHLTEALRMNPAEVHEGHRHHRDLRDLWGGLWLVVYLVFVYGLSALSSFKGTGTIPAPWDSILVAAGSLVIYAWAVRAGTTFLRDHDEMLEVLDHPKDAVPSTA